jgi:hypothetical protein
MRAQRADVRFGRWAVYGWIGAQDWSKYGPPGAMTDNAHHYLQRSQGYERTTPTSTGYGIGARMGARLIAVAGPNPPA